MPFGRSTSDVQPSQLAGTWYPAEPERLRDTVDRLLAEAAVAPDERIRAIIAPHAGYAYSGRAAGVGYAHVPAGRFRRALLLAPSHYHSFSGGAIFPGRGFETPLGSVEIDLDGVEQLSSSASFSMDPAPYRREHSLEIQLPFLQRVDPQLRIVPVLVSGRGEALSALAPGLRALDDDETLVVVSSDFTHYGASFDYLPFPSTGPREVAEQLHELDFGAIECICALDADGFESYLEATGATVCGQAPIVAFLRARGGLRGTVASYYTSLDVTGDYEHSVSYAAIVFTPAAA
jgi:hypothetical protein